MVPTVLKRIMGLLAVSSLFVLLVSQSTLAQATGAISGTMRDAQGIPITGIRIAVTAGLQLGCSDPNTGQYVITGLSLGSYIVAANGIAISCGDDTSAYATQYWQKASFPDAATPVVLTEQHPNATNIDFALAPGGSISGTLRDVKGTPLTGVSVSVALNFRDLHEPTEIYHCSDPATGNYRLGHIPLGFEYTVSAVVFPCGSGSEDFETVWWRNAPVPQGAQVLSLTASQPDLTAIDFRLRPKRGAQPPH